LTTGSDSGPRIDALDARVAGSLQSNLYADLQRLLRGATIWFLRHEKLGGGLEDLISRYRKGLDAVEAGLAGSLAAKPFDIARFAVAQ
jgi:glutamate dehydrogenase